MKLVSMLNEASYTVQLDFFHEESPDHGSVALFHGDVELASHKSAQHNRNYGQREKIYAEMMVTAQKKLAEMKVVKEATKKRKESPEEAEKVTNKKKPALSEVEAEKDKVKRAPAEAEAEKDKGVKVGKELCA
jgi:outer membrane biosynthesis protein TonB